MPGRSECEVVVDCDGGRIGANGVMVVVGVGTRPDVFRYFVVELAVFVYVVGGTAAVGEEVCDEFSLVVLVGFGFGRHSRLCSGLTILDVKKIILDFSTIL